MNFWHDPYVTWNEFEEREKRVYEHINQVIVAFDEAMDFLAIEHGMRLRERATCYGGIERVSPRRFEQAYQPAPPPKVKRCPKKGKGGGT